jgi:DNA-binding IclR family transcriptional regulator
VAPLAAAASGRLRRELRPYLEQLHQDVNETVDLAVLSEDKVFFIDQIPAPHRLQAVSSVGGTFPVHCTANGKALLAELPTEDIVRLLPEQLAVLTAHTIPTRAQLLDEVARIRIEGVAFDREEHTLGICAIGVALTVPLSGSIALSIPVPSIRFAGNEERLAAALRATAKRIRQRFEDL